MNHLKLFEDFEGNSPPDVEEFKKRFGSAPKSDKCPYCGSTNTKKSHWVKTARKCNNCDKVWDINIEN